MWYLSEYADFNRLCEFNNIFIYKIIEDIHANSCEPKEEWPHAGL